MLPEVYFLRYAFPCARVLVDFRKTLSEAEYVVMQKSVEAEVPLDRNYLEEKFPNAIDGLKKISEDYWNVDVIRRYFWEEHEENLSTDLPGMVHRLCVVKPGKLVKKIETNGTILFKADLGSGDVRWVVTLYKNSHVGDKAMIHYGFAVEKVDA